MISSSYLGDFACFGTFHGIVSITGLGGNPLPLLDNSECVGFQNFSPAVAARPNTTTSSPVQIHFCAIRDDFDLTFNRGDGLTQQLLIVRC
jgi:hypothetical protein